MADAQLLLGLDLGGQAVAVPAEPALDAAPAHRLEARHDVLHVPGQQVAVVRQAVRERRAVIEDELVAAVGPGVALLDAGPERAVGVPVPADALLDLREAGDAGTVAGACSSLTLGYVIGVPLAGRRSLPARTTSPGEPGGTAVPPRLPRLRGPLVIRLLVRAGPPGSSEGSRPVLPEAPR
ncbi:hypothetical protein GCM10025868_09990 [Angustibacter aerolatus]|uniref:Uncharacterized protein n=1 Tax=Angustibacter aerolatus TaxID=1162965 RepID=A0ABQ6JEA4_9ACTN|nr:hypothetical protein GCM10025868_09990 [Angustibacter aerolatus]